MNSQCRQTLSFQPLDAAKWYREGRSDRTGILCCIPRTYDGNVHCRTEGRDQSRQRENHVGDASKFDQVTYATRKLREEKWC